MRLQGPIPRHGSVTLRRSVIGWKLLSIPLCRHGRHLHVTYIGVACIDFRALNRHYLQWSRYVNTTQNDLDYWGLDYPPLTAYQVNPAVACLLISPVKASHSCVVWACQSWLFGKVIEHYEPEAVALGTSRGYETPSSKTLLRWSAVAADVLGEPFPHLRLGAPSMRSCAGHQRAAWPQCSFRRLWRACTSSTAGPSWMSVHGCCARHCCSLQRC